MERYQGKKAVIIGGTSGMGLATAKMLLNGGARVLVTGRSQSGLDSAQKELGNEAIVVSSDARSLTEIERQSGISVPELAASLLVHQSTASNLLDGLEQKALIAKYRTKDDQRVVRLRVTAKGHSLLSRAPAPTVGVLLDALQKVPKETLWGLSINMSDLIAIMNRKDPAGESKPLADI